MLSYNHENLTVTFSGNKTCKTTTAIEDIRVAIDNNSLSNTIQDSMDILHYELSNEYIEKIL